MITLVHTSPDVEGKDLIPHISHLFLISPCYSPAPLVKGIISVIGRPILALA